MLALHVVADRNATAVYRYGYLYKHCNAPGSIVLVLMTKLMSVQRTHGYFTLNPKASFIMFW